MAIEDTIFGQVETLLDDMKATPADYNLTWKYIETRDENLDPNAIDPTTDAPIAFIGYGESGQQNRGFLDMPSVGMIRELMPIWVRVVLYDTRTGDGMSTLVSKAREDIRKAIGDSLRTISGVYEAWVGAYFQAQNRWFSDTEEFIVPINVWYEYEQRAVVAPTVSGLVIPSNITFTVGGGQVTISYDALVSPQVSVNVYRNGTQVKTGYTDTQWTDTEWFWTNTYQLGAVDASSNEVKTDIFSFPYYPTTSPELNFYKPVWTLSQDFLNQIILGKASPEHVIANRIRQYIELDRIDNGVLADDLNYTVAGDIPSSAIADGNFPMAHIEMGNTALSFVNTAELMREATFGLNVYANAATTAADRIDGRVQVDRILFNLERLASADRVTGNAQNWGLGFVTQTTFVGKNRTPNAVLLGNQTVVSGRLEITVHYDLTWRE